MEDAFMQPFSTGAPFGHGLPASDPACAYQGTLSHSLCCATSRAENSPCENSSAPEIEIKRPLQALALQPKQLPTRALIEPQNIIIERHSGKLVLIDWGFLKAKDPDESGESCQKVKDTLTSFLNTFRGPQYRRAYAAAHESEGPHT
jgi:hypothetical protein